MTNEQKKDLKKYLNRVFELTTAKQSLEREYKQKLKEMDSISVPFQEIKASRIKSKVENKAIDLVRLAEDIDLHNVKIEEAKMEIACVIDKLEYKLKNLLRLRYLELKKWREIEYVLCYSEQHIHFLHNKALKEINEFFKRY